MDEISTQKYATIDIPDGMSFTAISKELEKSGYKLTPARTRLIILNSLSNMVRKIGRANGMPMSRQQAMTTVKEPQFQNIISPFIQKAYDE